MITIPYSEDHEKAVLVSVLTDPRLLPKISAILNVEDFYKERHRQIYQAIESIDIDSLDSLAVQDKLSEETATYFKELIAESERIIPATSNALFYAETVKEKAKLRAGIDLGNRIIAACYAETDADEAIDELEDMFATFLRQRVLETKVESSSEAFKKFMESLQTRKPDDPNAIRTGFYEVDLMLQRLEGLVVLAARPSMGKTALAINMIANVLKKEHSVVFFSLEQNRDQVFERMLAAEAEVPLEEIRLGVFNNNVASKDRIEIAQDKIKHLTKLLHVDDKANVPTKYITSVARQKAYEWGSVGLIVIDYLNIVQRDDKKSTVDALGDVTREFRALGKELDCPVLLLAQLSRASESQERKKSRRPELSDLRSSGEIEQNADSVIFIYRDSYYETAGLAPDEDIAEIIVKKNRSGRQGFVLLEWHPTMVKFKDAARNKY